MTRALLSRQIASFAVDLRDEDIPAATRARAAHLMLDAAGLAAATTDRDFARRTLDGLALLTGGKRDTGGPGMGAAGNSPPAAAGVPVLFTPYMLPAQAAALMNGLLIHGLDFDDTNPRAVLHPTASVLPALISAVHMPGLVSREPSGRQLLTAYLLGVEVACFVGTAASGAFHARGFHPTAVAGIFGCVAAVGRLAGLSPDEIANAQGLALSFASGSLEFLADGAWNKRYHPGWAAQGALTAVALAKAGAIGTSDPYTGRHGAFSLFTGTNASSPDAVDFDRRDGWATDATAVKPFPACHFTHACVDAALALRERGVQADDIERILALVPAPTIPVVCEPADRKKRPENAYDAQFSVPYLVAAGFVKGRVTTSEIDGPCLQDPAILALAARVDHEADPHTTFPAAYSGELVVTLRDGSEVRHREAINRGAADRPLSDDQIVAKFRDNCGERLGAKARAVEDVLLHIDAAPSARLAFSTLRAS